MKNKLSKVLCLTALIGLWGGEAAYAQGGHSQNSSTNAEQIQSQNTRHKTPHADRKTAALRPRKAHEQQHQQHLATSALHKHGYTGRGKRGGK